MLLPLSIGMLYLHFFPRSAGPLSKWSIRGSLIGIIMIVVGCAINGRFKIAAFGYNNLLLIMLFALALFVPGYNYNRFVAPAPSCP